MSSVPGVVNCDAVISVRYFRYGREWLRTSVVVPSEKWTGFPPFCLQLKLARCTRVSARDREDLSMLVEASGKVIVATAGANVPKRRRLVLIAGMKVCRDFFASGIGATESSCDAISRHAAKHWTSH